MEECCKNWKGYSHKMGGVAVIFTYCPQCGSPIRSLPIELLPLNPTDVTVRNKVRELIERVNELSVS